MSEPALDRGDAIYILDELELRPGMLGAFFEALEAGYLPGAEARGLELVHRWVTPPVELEGVDVSVLLVWRLAGIPGFWEMRSQSGAPEVAQWWRDCERFIHTRTRRYAAEADALAGFAAAGRTNA